MPRYCKALFSLFLISTCCSPSFAGVGDPQVATDDVWYPGELSCSTYERLFATQAALYQQVTGKPVRTDEDKILAAWLWRNTHYWHGEEGAQDLWGKGFTGGPDRREREYWTGLFAHGFGLCGTTHSQWVPEIQTLLGPGRSRSVGTVGHNSFEAFLKGGPYGEGRWVLIDHDLSTIRFSEDGSRLLGIREVAADWKRLTDRTFSTSAQRGWLVCGLHPDDGGSLAQFNVAEYLSGYAGPPPMVHLRMGESLRRYLKPGLEDGKTFVFWGRNYNAGNIPGPERSRTWVNQPENMYGSKTGTPHRTGQARYANAVYTYEPDFATGDYKEGIIEESDDFVTLEFASPYIIAATPPNDKPWGIYDAGCKNGLVISSNAGCEVSVSVDRGQNWHAAGKLTGQADLTDYVKGHRQYWLKLHAGADALKKQPIKIVTVCQMNSSVIPRLTENGSTVQYESTGQAVVSAGPNLPQAAAHVTEGGFDSPKVTMKLGTPRNEPATGVYAAAHVLSSNPPDPKVKYQIEYRQAGEGAWEPLVKDWSILRQGDEPKDFWSQSLCWGDVPLDPQATTSNVEVRFSNNAGKRYARAELHLTYRIKQQDPCQVTFAWNDTNGPQSHRHVVKGDRDQWQVPTGKDVEMLWVEYRPVVK